MENQTVTHISVGTKYRVVFEQAASTKGILGFKIESQGDDLEAVMDEAKILLWRAQVATQPATQEPAPSGER